MPISRGEMIGLLEGEDEDTILELLDITSEELVKAFSWKLKQRKHYVEKFFEETLTQTEEEYGIGVHIEGWEGGVPFGEGDEE